MRRILVYSHDTYGLGNIRRMLAIVRRLAEEFGDVTMLMVSGSPLMQAFRMPPGVDYIKLPCLRRDHRGIYSAKSLGISYERMLSLRADLILNAFINFEPDLVLVDKKPLGVRNELAPTLEVMRRRANRPKLVLMLRDILDDPDQTTEIWRRNRYHETIAELYDRVLILGSADIFDTTAEYAFPQATLEKSHYCGYINKAQWEHPHADLGRHLDGSGRPLLLATAGGGEDGARIFDAVLEAAEFHDLGATYQPLLILGPELESGAKATIEVRAANVDVRVIDFTDDFMSYLRAAEAVVCMGGYNTLTEALALNKQVVVIPRVTPVSEQLIRARALAERGLVQMLEPDALNAESLAQTLASITAGQPLNGPNEYPIDLCGLDRIVDHVSDLLDQRQHNGWGQIQMSDERESVAGDIDVSIQNPRRPFGWSLELSTAD